MKKQQIIWITCFNLYFTSEFVSDKKILDNVSDKNIGFDRKNQNLPKYFIIDTDLSYI